MNDFGARILEDSIGPHEIRLTTLEVTFPRFILAEFNTHRMLSRNSASSRAIPPEQHIERVRNFPFTPNMNKRVKGMGVGDALTEEEQAEAQGWWHTARVAAQGAAEMLVRLDVDKSRVNRLLEPFMWHTAIVTATEWENFFALRDHPDAQPEFQRVARMMREVMEESEPNELGLDEWHLPFVSGQEKIDRLPTSCAMVSARRCARVSFDRHTETEKWEVSWDKADQLLKSGHMSPFEHQAEVLPDDSWSGNFRGWLQFRKTLPWEDNFGARP